MVKKSKTGKERLDKYYHLAKDQGYRARSAFKLIQLAKKFDFLSKSRICIDLCAAPGGWSQVAQRNMPTGAQILAIDLCPIKPIPGVICIQQDITSDKCRNLVRKELKGEKADCVLHDGAPNVGANWVKDAYGQCELTLQATRIACDHLKQGGTFVTKVFRSADYNSLLWVFNQLFKKVDATKPTASRNVSAEIFVMCIGFKAGKIDPRFFDPKWVFMETVEPEAAARAGTSGKGVSLGELVKHQGKKHRGGYELGDDLKILPLHEFVNSANPAEILVTYHRLNLEAEGSEELAAHELTTDEIRELCGDLKILGKRDLTALMKWRMRILRGREKADRKARKEEVAAAKADAENAEAGSAAATDTNGALGQDVDDAITAFLKEGGEGTADGGDDEESEVDEEMEKELSEQVAKRRREERIERKKTMARQKKMEWRKKLSLGGGRDHEQQDQPELFKVNQRNVQALEDEDKYIVPQLSEEEESDVGGAPRPDSDSDSELDRVAKMEVDLAVGHELDKMRNDDKFRTQMQRQRKKKKETRRQRVMAAWSGELSAFNEAIDEQAAALKDKENEDSDDDDSALADDDLKQLRDLQGALQNGATSAVSADAEALEALLDGGHPAAAASSARGSGEVNANEEEESDDGSVVEGALGPAKRPKALGDGGASNALVPKDDPEESGLEALKSERRASRWFSQDIFKSIGGAAAVGDGDDASDEDEDEEDDAAIREFEDEELPQLPITDKEKRRLKRKREKEKLEKFGKKPKTNADDDGPVEVAPLEPPRPLVPLDGSAPSKPQKPTDPQELAETMALGSLLVNSKKSRMELIDAAYNRWTFDHDPTLPEWFTEDENKHNKPELPISKELMQQFRSKLREINARPIRKVAEAKARKNRRLKHRLEKIRSTAMGLAENGELSEVAKARHMRKAVSQMARQEQRKVQVIAMKKGGGGNKTAKGKVPKGAATKVVDRRMKSDRRGEKKAQKKDPKKYNKMLKKKAVKNLKVKNRRVHGLGGGRKKKGGGGSA